MGRTTEVYSDVSVNRGPKSSENVMQEMAEAFFIGLDKIIQREKLPTTYSQTRSSVPVANELINSLTEK